MDDRYENNPMLLKRRNPDATSVTPDEAAALKKENPLEFLSRIPFYAKIRDLNNSDDSPHENPPHPALEFGLKITF